MEVSMVTKVGDRDVIRTMPFVQIKMALAAGHKTTRSYPPSIRSRSCRGRRRRRPHRATAGQIYGVKVESEMSLKTVDFPIDTAAFDEKSGLSADEVEKVVRETGADPDRRRRPGRGTPLYRTRAIRRRAVPSRRSMPPMACRIVPENVRVTPRTASTRRPWSSPKTSSLSTPTARSPKPSPTRAMPATMPPAWPSHRQAVQCHRR